ncbi:MAG: hypothetical protein ABR547_10560, partial [Halanaerobium sp.]
LLLIFSLSFVLSGCSAIGELKTETILNDYLESKEGPKGVIAQSFDKLLEEFEGNNTLNDYDWEYTIELKTVNIINSKADEDGTGILTANDIILEYKYTIKGDPKNNELSPINKTDDLYLTYNITELQYDDNKDELEMMTSTQAERQDKSSQSPLISNIEKINSDDGELILKGDIEEHTESSILGVISLGDRNFSELNNQVLNISDTKLSVDTGLTLNKTDFASILVINYDELLDNSSEQTGLAAVLISAP